MLPTKKITFDPSDLRKELSSIREEHKKLIRMAKKFEEYYSEHEDRIAALDAKIYKAEQDNGLTREEVIASMSDNSDDELAASLFS